MNRQLKFFFMCFSIVLLLLGCGKKEEEPVDVVEKEAEPTITVDNAISADGVSIAYEVRGEGEPALVFIHGWCCDRSYWEEQIPHFAEKYKVVAIDLAGHGESGLDRKEWTMKAFSKMWPPVTAFDLTVEDINGPDDLAYIRGAYSQTIALEGAPEPIQDKGKFVEIMRKQQDGSWLISVDILNSDIPLPPPPEKE